MSVAGQPVAQIISEIFSEIRAVVSKFLGVDDSTSIELGDTRRTDHWQKGDAINPETEKSESGKSVDCEQ